MQTSKKVSSQVKCGDGGSQIEKCFVAHTCQLVVRDVQLLEMINYVEQAVQTVQAYLQGGQGREDVGLQSG